MKFTQYFFRNKPQDKNANIANLVLAVPLENNCSNGEYNFKMQLSQTH